MAVQVKCVAVGRVEVGVAEADRLERFVVAGDDHAHRSCAFLSMRAAIAMPATWYVTVELHKSGVLPKPRHPRQTTTFETKAGAMDFARARLSEGLIVFAGTINPFVPREHIPSARIAAWLDGERR